MKTWIPTLALSLLAGLASAPTHDAHGSPGGHGAASQPAAAPAASALPRVQAVVRTVDKAAKKITLRHGDIPNLDMGAMTMVFQVADAALLDKVKPGDEVLFTADKIRGAYTVLTIEPLRK
ncbi:MAG: copper-binding protein [Hylemonella sp.]